MKSIKITLLSLTLLLLLSGCGKKTEKDPLETSIGFNLDNITSNPMTVTEGAAFITNLSDYVICNNIDSVVLQVETKDGTQTNSLPALYHCENSPYTLLFTDETTGDYIYLYIYVEADESSANGTSIENYDPALDPGYEPIDLDEINDDYFTPETYTESDIYLYYSNLELLTDINFMPSSAYADINSKTQAFIEQYSDGMNWPKAEYCYILESSIYQSSEYSSFNIYVHPIDKLEIKVYFYPDSGFQFEIVSY